MYRNTPKNILFHNIKLKIHVANKKSNNLKQIYLAIQIIQKFCFIFIVNYVRKILSKSLFLKQ